jgi:hypothetical protein
LSPQNSNGRRPWGKPAALLVAGVLIAVGIGVGAGLVPFKTAGTPAGADSGGGGSNSTSPVGTGVQLRELDFGFVELNPNLPTPITSYKHGGNMVLYAGEELRFQVLGDAPHPRIELHVGTQVQPMDGASGSLRVQLDAVGPVPARMLAQGSRHSLPGGAPPRVSVKVQVHGPPRPP